MRISISLRRPLVELLWIYIRNLEWADKLYWEAQDATVTAKIYDVTGKQIRMIELGHVVAENYAESSKAIYWDGRTEDGEQVPSGTYFYQIEAGDYTETRKMVILK